MHYFSQLIEKEAKLPRLDNRGVNQSSAFLRQSRSSQNLTSRKRTYDSLPALGEPLILRYNKKALYNKEMENKTLGNYRVYKPKNTRNDWSTIQVFNHKRPRMYLRESVERGKRERFFQNKSSIRERGASYGYK